MNIIIQYGLFIGVLLALAYPLGAYLSRVFAGQNRLSQKILGPLERLLYKVTGISPDQEMSWKGWALALMTFSLLEIVVLFFSLMYQNYLPLNPNNLGGMTWDLALNTAISFVTNTNWQSYSGETTMSYFSQMVGLAVKNFTSAAAGIAVMTALFRAFSRRDAKALGNFWVDLIRSTLYLLLPLSIIVAIILLSQGVIQNFSANVVVDTLSGQSQTIPMGPIASQEAIKLLGTNGGGFFNANSAHPFENPTAFTNFLEMLSILLIPTALIFAFGRMIKDLRQSWLIFGVMALVLTTWVGLNVWAETSTPQLAAAGVPIDQSLGNMEGKETRFGVFSSALFANITTATSCGAVNSMHDSFTPMGGFFPLTMMMMGEVIFGGVGSGLYGMLIQILLTVFIAGLMVGRTPEYLGKKIEPYDMIMVSIAILITPLLVLLGTAATLLWPGLTDPATPVFANGFPQGFTELLYAFTSAANNNGSAFAGLTANYPFLNTLLGVVMFLGRFGVMIPVLALAGSLVQKKIVPASVGTLPTHGLVFGILLIGVILLVGALNFIPALCLGPVAQALF